MMRLQTRLAQRLGALAAIGALGAGAAGCNAAQAGSEPNVDVVAQADVVSDLAKQCGLACPGDEDDKGVEIKGVAQGNAAISGVASIDTFFASVIEFQATATGVAGGIQAQLNAIKGDFGIAADADLAAELDTKFKANLEGSAEFKVEPARCSADVKATLDAKARCEGEVTPGMVSVDCKGSCEMDVSADVKCDASADLQCTVIPPNLMCMGQCQGSCKAMIMGSAACSGKCEGTCSGSCDAYVKDAMGQAKCAGKCDGMCTGSCEAELAVAAECKGECRGECTYTPPSGTCSGAVRAECKAKANAMFKCEGKCQGDFEPPMVKAECKASVKAQAKMKVQCTPPRVAFNYKLKAAAGAEVQARAKFEAALLTLVNTRLPALKAELARADSVIQAAGELTTAAGGGIKGAIEAVGSGDASVKAKFGVICAVGQLEAAGKVVTDAKAKLDAQISTAAKLNTLLKV